MDPITIDLSSIAGVVTLTLVLVHYLKPRLGRITFLQELPVSLYVVTVAAGLTWLAHDVLHKLEGDLLALAIQAVVSALAASGAVEWWRAGGDSVGDTHAAVKARQQAAAKRGGFYMIPILLALGFGSSGCASMGYRTGHALVQAETAIHDAIGITVETGNRLCAAKILDAPRCVQFNEKLLPVLKDAKAFNQAIQTNSAASIPAMVIALDHLADDVVGLVPTAADRALVIEKINTARVLLRSFRGGK